MSDSLDPEIEARACVRCGRQLDPAEVFYRFRVTMEGDQDLAALAALPAGDSPGDLLARMEAEGDWARYGDDVHWERDGVVCTGCRAILCAMIGDFTSGRSSPES